MSGWSLDNPLFTSYLFYSGILAFKMLLMGPITGYYRISRKAFVNPEDAAAMGAKEVKINEEVERVRRAHQNDLENIPVFWVLGLFYLLTNPSPFTASLLFRAFTISRIMHTVMYLLASDKRGMSYFIGVLINFTMAVNVICTFW